MMSVGVLADMDPNAPWWVGVGISVMGLVVAIAYAMLKVVDAYKVKSREWRKLDADADGDEDKTLTNQQRTERRDSAVEAWLVVDRMTKEIEGHDGKLKAVLEAHAAKIKDIEERERQCNEDRAMDRAACAEDRVTDRAQYAALHAVVRMMGAWIQSQKNAMPGLADILRGLDANGSGPHQPVPTGGQP